MTETYGTWFVKRYPGSNSFVLARRVYEGQTVIRLQHLKSTKGRDLYFLKEANARAAAYEANKEAA